MAGTRIIRGQVISGTRVDRHGERLSREELELLFEQWPDKMQSAVQHDLSRPPVCRAFNPQLEEEPDGELSLKADIEVFDEEEFSRFGGFSVSFFRKRVRLGHGAAAVAVTLNPRQYDFDSMVAAIAQALDQDSDAVDVRERVEKADVATIAAIVTIIVFVATQTVGGFLNAAGAALFDLIRKQKRKDDPAAPTAVQFHLHVQLSTERVTPIILVVDSDCTTEDVQAIDGPALVEAARAQLGDSTERIVGRVLPGGEVKIEGAFGRGRQMVQGETEKNA